MQAGTRNIETTRSPVEQQFIPASRHIALGEVDLSLGEPGDGIVSARRRNAARLSELLEPFEHYLQLPRQLEGSDHAFLMYPIVVRPPYSRDALVNYLERHGIETRCMVPLLCQAVYQSVFGNQEKQYLVVGDLARCGFCIGCHEMLSEQDLAYVADIFSSYFAGDGGATREAQQGAVSEPTATEAAQ